MRISLSTQALERLLGGDTELEIQLRHQVVENFSKNHLKTLINSEAHRIMTEAWRKDIAEQVKVAVAEFQSAPSKAAQTETSVESSVRNHGGLRFTVNKAIEETITKVVHEKLDTYTKFIQSEVERRVSVAVTANIAAQVSSGIQKQLQLAAELADTLTPQQNKISKKAQG